MKKALNVLLDKKLKSKLIPLLEQKDTVTISEIQGYSLKDIADLCPDRVKQQLPSLKTQVLEEYLSRL
jgi:hypothetical protein